MINSIKYETNTSSLLACKESLVEGACITQQNQANPLIHAIHCSDTYSTVGTYEFSTIFFWWYF